MLQSYFKSALANLPRNKIAGLAIGLAACIPLGGCNAQSEKSSTTNNNTNIVTTQDASVTLKTDAMVIQYQIDNDELMDWTIAPQLSPDTLYVQCTKDENTFVKFLTDSQERTFSVSGEDTLRFNILIEGNVTALTEIKCIPKRVRYRGDYAVGASNSANLATKLEPVLNTYFDDDRPGIILAVSEYNQPIFMTAQGVANLDDRVPRNFEESFDIASVSKEFTAIAILQLVERELISLESPISLYLDGIPNGENITIHHLLTHTHGLPQILDADGYDGTRPLDTNVSLDILRGLEINFEPGARYQYGNTAYFLLAHIAELVSGQTRNSYFREHIFGPANMTESSFITETASAGTRVMGYNETSKNITLRTFEFHDSQATGTGDVISNLNDMLKWQRAITDGTLISSEMFALASAPKYLNDGTEIARGYGFFRGTLDGEIIIYNTGDFYTHTRHFYMPSRDISVILNMNGSIEFDGALSSVVFLQILGKIFDREKLNMFDETIDLNKL